ncbi:MAG: hypothetical protein IPL07_17955 [Acidimicrobiaceae bacterium]|nr:hypothetical protein [Acidimicrobiaceae bacterium]
MSDNADEDNDIRGTLRATSKPTHSGLAEPIAVTGIVRPPWLAAVVDEVGVLTCSLAEAIASYASL